jgi:hypothetical protein
MSAYVLQNDGLAVVILVDSPYFERVKRGLGNHLTVYVCISSPIFARQQHGKHVPAAKNTHTNNRIAGRCVFYSTEPETKNGFAGEYQQKFTAVLCYEGK